MCVYLLLAVLCGSSDIPLHNKSAVFLTISSLCVSILLGWVRWGVNYRGYSPFIKHPLWQLGSVNGMLMKSHCGGLSELPEDECSPQLWATADVDFSFCRVEPLSPFQQMASSRDSMKSTTVGSFFITYCNTVRFGCICVNWNACQSIWRAGKAPVDKWVSGLHIRGKSKSIYLLNQPNLKNNK